MEEFMFYTILTCFSNKMYTQLKMKGKANLTLHINDLAKRRNVQNILPRQKNKHTSFDALVWNWTPDGIL